LRAQVDFSGAIYAPDDHVNTIWKWYHMMRGPPARSVDPRVAYNAQREELDKRRGAVSPLLTGVAKPAPPRKGLKP
jgi:hypothetical protein